MPVNLGSSAVSLYLGDQSVTGYIGSQIVTASVPGAPTISGAYYSPFMPGTFATLAAPASDGGSPVTGYRFYFNGVATMIYTGQESGVPGVLFFELAEPGPGDVLEAAAVNANGEGPKSAPVTVDG